MTTEADLYRLHLIQSNGQQVMQIALAQAHCHDDLTVSQAIIGAYVARYVQGIRQGVF